MNQEIYNHIMELLNDLIIFKGYQIHDKEEFCKMIMQRISDDKAFSVIIGEMDEEIEDLIDDVYFGRVNEGKNDVKLENDVDTSEFDALLHIFSSSKENVDDNKKKIEFQNIDSSKINKAFRELYGMSEKFGNDKEGLALNHVFIIANLSGYTFTRSDKGNSYSSIEYVARNILKIYFSENQYDDIINGMYDEQISQLVIFRSIEFSDTMEKVYESLKKNSYYLNNKQFFNSKIAYNISFNATMILLSARKEGIELNTQQVVDEVVLKIVFPYGTESYKEPLVDKVDNFKKMMRFTKEELIAAGLVSFVILFDMAIPAIVLPIIAYSYINDLKVSNDEELQHNNNRSVR